MKMFLDRDSEEEKVPAFQAERRKTFRELSGREKVAYLWDYYKWWFIFGGIFIFVSVYSLPGIIENHKEPVLYAAFVNTQIVSQENTSLMEDFVEAEGFDMKGKRIVLDTSLMINRNKADSVSMQCNQKLIALLSSHTLDVLVCDEENFQFYAENGCFQSLEEVLPEDLFERLRPYMLTCDSDKGDTEIYYGIDVGGSEVLAKEGAYQVEPIFTICTNAKRTENAVKFLEYLMGDK